MTKIVSATEMAAIEKEAYKLGCCEVNFMENAGHGIAVAAVNFITSHNLARTVWLLCGKGNNGGDAFVAGRHLLAKDCQVRAILIEEIKLCSPLCQRNAQLFLENGGKIQSVADFENSEGIIIDGLFGTGFHGELNPSYAQLVSMANKSGLPILAIDIASGLNGTSGEQSSVCIQATETLFLELPKLGCFLQNGWNVTGQLRQVKFGLPETLITHSKMQIELIDTHLAASYLPPMVRNRHKYQAGMVTGWAGSPQMPGAALLAALAAFRSGSGLVKLLHPQGMEAQLAASPYELIKVSYQSDALETLTTCLNKAAATFIGPGLSKTNELSNMLQQIMPQLEKPCVIDADALAIFSKQPFHLPAQTIFTPHHGEMQNLLQTNTFSLDAYMLQTCQEYAQAQKIVLILKGAPTFIFAADKPILVSSRGDPGMATAGCGDVLTGVLAALLAQKLNAHKAATTGVYLHGLAGEYAALERGTSYGLMASDVIQHLAAAFSYLQTEFILTNTFNCL